ncbi:MAG: type II secretion system protein [Anaerohalosphaera sp.]|nr:type II secretion system protein [Anaerohalosphaera sp.]
MKRRRKKAFTLIELLVVISIIALLLAILMPALGKVKKKAQSVVCKSNLKQLQLAASLYANDYDSKYFAYGGDVYINHLSPYIGEVDSARYCKASKISSRIETELADLKSGAGWPALMGSADETWGWWSNTVDPEYGSYTFNGYLYPNLAQIGVVGADVAANSFSKVTQIKNMYATPVFTDGVWVDTWPMDDETTAPTDFEIAMGYGHEWQNDYYIWRLITNRHGKITNISFADGHVDSVKLADLWTLQWCREFEKTEDVTIPGISR